MHLDERRNGVRRVRQQQEVARRCDIESDGGQHHEPRYGANEAGRGEDAAHRSEERALEAAVDDERLPCHVARAVRREKADDVAELARFAPAAQRDLREIGLRRAVRIELVDAGGFDAAWRDAADRDPLGSAQQDRPSLLPERLVVLIDPVVLWTADEHDA